MDRLDPDYVGASLLAMSVCQTPQNLLNTLHEQPHHALHLALTARRFQDAGNQNKEAPSCLPVS
jgi:hypothetical protein